MPRRSWTITSNSSNPGTVSPDHSFDAALFVDADLAVLGSEPERYDQYAGAIRREYSTYADDVYRSGRLRVLEDLLERPVIFHTGEMRGRFEANARANILGEIERRGAPH